jgi:hypothetical protein
MKLIPLTKGQFAKINDFIFNFLVFTVPNH